MTHLKKAFICLFIGAIVTGCTSNENTEERAKTPASVDSNSSSQPIDTPSAPQPAYTPTKKPVTEPAKRNVTNDWRPLVKEYHEILCRQHNGVSTTEDKIRLAELTRDFGLLQLTLPLSERSEFIAGKAHAIETEDCK